MRKGWEKKKLGEVITLEYGKPLPETDRCQDAGYPAYGANGVKCFAKSYYCNEKSIIVGRKGSAGEVTLTEQKFWPLDVTYYVKYNKNEYNLKYLFYCLSNLKLQSLAKGVKPGINRSEVYSIDISVTNLPEQRRIITILDDAFERIDKAIANTEKNIANAKELFERFLNNEFENCNSDLNIVLVSEICESIVDCVNKTAPTVAKETPFKMIRTTNVKRGKVNLDNVKFVSEDVYRQWTRRQVPQVGDILLTREAPMGEVGMLLSNENVFLGQRIVSYRADKSKVDNWFLYYALQTKYIQEQMSSVASGATVQHIRVPDTGKWRIQLPELARQKTIVERLNAAKEMANNFELINITKLTSLHALKQSLLASAFSGELSADFNPDALEL